MNIENALRIVGKKDSCAIERRANGAISIGSILISEDEIAEFPKALAQALACLPRTDLDGKPISPAPESR